MGERLESGCRDGKADRLAELESLIEALTRYKATPRPLQQPINPLNEQPDMNTLKRLWQVLNSDITPTLKAIRDNILDIYDLELVPVHSGDLTVEWVSARTGERPWI